MIGKIGGREDRPNKLQKEIVTDLEKLIAELEKQCQKCQGGSMLQQQVCSRRPSANRSSSPRKRRATVSTMRKKPAKDSTERLGKDEARKAALEKMKSLLKEDIWGELPPKDREQMLQLSPEQFLPKYELLIEEYYKRLAEQTEKVESGDLSHVAAAFADLRLPTSDFVSRRQLPCHGCGTRRCTSARRRSRQSRENRPSR